MFRNQIDKIGIRVKKNQCKKFRITSYNPHVYLKEYYDEVLITASSKCVLEYNKLPSITFSNVDKYAEIISQSTGYDLSAEVLLNLPLYWLDMKIDCANTTGFSNTKIISILREKSYKSTNKNETPSYEKNKGYKNSLLIKSTCKTVKESFCVYDKIAEIKANKWKDNKYYNNFSEDFLSEHYNLLRFERRMQSAKDIKKAFNLPNNKIVTLVDIFSSNQNVVSDKINELFMRGGKMSDNRIKTNKKNKTKENKELATYLRLLYMSSN